MKSLLLALSLAASASASISVIPSAISYTMRSGQTIPAALNFLPPKNQVLTITSSGSWTVAVSGTLSTACLFGGSCLIVSGPFDNTSVTSGSGNATLNVNWNLGSMVYNAPATYMGTITFTEGANTASTSVTVINKNDTTFPTTGTMKVISRGNEAGCSVQPSFNSNFVNAMFTYSNLCSIPNEAPAAAASIVQPSVGSSYVDSQFGGRVTRLTANGVVYSYSGITPFSAQDGYIVTSAGVYNRLTGALTRAIGSYPQAFNQTNTYPSATQDSLFYATLGSAIYKYDFVTPSGGSVPIGDLVASPYCLSTLYEGGTQGVTEDNWQAFYDNGGATSTGSFAAAVGSHTMTVSGGCFAVGQKIIVTSQSTPNDSATGTVTSSVGSSVTFNATSATGSGGTYSAWNISRFNTRICAVNLPLMETEGGATMNNTYCADFDSSSAPGFTSFPDDPDWVQVNDIDLPTGLRFVYLSQQFVTSGNRLAGSAVFHVGAYGSGALVQDFIMPEQQQASYNNDNGICETSEACYNSQFFTHAINCRDADGQIWMFGNIQSLILNNLTGNAYWYGWARLSAGLGIMRPIEEGGGLRLLNQLQWDIQPSCSSRVHAWGLTANPAFNHFGGNITGTPVYSAGSGGFVTMTLDVTPTWATTEAVRIQGATGSWAPLNGAWTSTFISGNTVTVPCSACSGSSGAIAAGAILTDALPDPVAATVGDRSQLEIYQPGKAMHRIAMHRDVSWANIPGCITPPDNGYQQRSARGAISRSGKYMAFASNYGALDCAGPAVYWVDTGLDASILTAYTATPAATNAILSYNVSDSSACSTEVSAGSSFSSILRTITDPGGTTARNYSLGALTAATNYWTRTTCGQQVETAYFTTLPALTSTRSTTVQIGAISGLAGVNNVVLEYRLSGGSSYTAVTAVPCASGCSVTWPADVGIEEYRFNWRNSGNTVLLTTQTYLMVVNR